ncbi:YqaI-like protein [Bacillus thuringiensis]|uniref:YqaI-like protein n=1 Tax=Bacillus thuringiensis TaxID=1428 RepID=A0A4R4BKJ0_BACTU|nr:YqaI-like protein [Bacillus thuringiensis]TCW59787.1 YqaI-like protein [Bacillus thuringiensis]
MVFKSGAKVSFTAEQFKTITNGFGSLTKIEYTGAATKVPFHISVSNIDAIFVKEIGEKRITIKEPDHPIEDYYGCEIKQDDKYFMFGQDVVLEGNLTNYLIAQQNVECFRAV